MGAPLGNRNARKAKEWQLALKRSLARRGDGDWRKALDKIADKVLDMAEAGDQAAWKDVADRIEGKPAQSLEIDGNLSTHVSGLSRAELELIASGAGGTGTIEEDGGEGIPSLTH